MRQHRNSRSHPVRCQTAITLALGAARRASRQPKRRAEEHESGGAHRPAGRPSYQPNVIQYPDGRWIAVRRACTAAFRWPVRAVTANTAAESAERQRMREQRDDDHRRHRSGESGREGADSGAAGGQAQMARMCLGSQLPGGTGGQGLSDAQRSGRRLGSGYEVWDVTNVVGAGARVGADAAFARRTSSGGSATPASRTCRAARTHSAGAPLWRQSQAMLIYDWSNPNAPPVYIRTFGLPGGQPTRDGPRARTRCTVRSRRTSIRRQRSALRARATADDIIGNRIYAAWGVGDDGVMTIIDRKKLLPAAYGGTWVPATADERGLADRGGADRPDVADRRLLH